MYMAIYKVWGVCVKSKGRPPGYKVLITRGLTRHTASQSQRVLACSGWTSDILYIHGTRQHAAHTLPCQQPTEHAPHGPRNLAERVLRTLLYRSPLRPEPLQALEGFAARQSTRLPAPLLSRWVPKTSDRASAVRYPPLSVHRRNPPRCPRTWQSQPSSAPLPCPS